MLPERPLSYRAQDDEDHHQALCGLAPDERAGEELEDFYARHYDFTGVLPVAAPHNGSDSNDRILSAVSGAPWTSFDLRVSPPSAKQGPEDVGGAPARRVLHVLWSHPPFLT